MAIGDVTFYANYVHYAGVDYTAEPTMSGQNYACSGGETTGELYDLLDNKNTAQVTIDVSGESATAVLRIDTTTNITNNNTVIIDNHNMGTAGTEIKVYNSGGQFGISTAYSGTLGTELTSLTISSNQARFTSPGHDGVAIFNIATETDNEWYVYFDCFDATFGADILLGEAFFSVSQSPSIAPDINIIEKNKQPGITINNTLGGQKSSHKKYNDRDAWSLTWSYMSEADKTILETVWAVTEGSRFPFYIDLGENTNPTLYYVRFMQDNLSFKKLTSNAYTTTILIESEV